MIITIIKIEIIFLNFILINIFLYQILN